MGMARVVMHLKTAIDPVTNREIVLISVKNILQRP